MYENVNFNQWQKLAKQVLGEQFFTDFMPWNQPSNGPRYNLYRNSSEVVILVELPYIVNVSQVKLTVREQELVIKGEISFGYDHLEAVQEQIFTGPFEKVIPLPVAVNSKRVNAQYQRGILFIQLFPKLRKDGHQVSIE